MSFLYFIQSLVPFDISYLTVILHSKFLLTNPPSFALLLCNFVSSAFYSRPFLTSYWSFKFVYLFRHCTSPWCDFKNKQTTLRPCVSPTLLHLPPSPNPHPLTPLTSLPYHQTSLLPYPHSPSPPTIASLNHSPFLCTLPHSIIF